MIENREPVPANGHVAGTETDEPTLSGCRRGISGDPCADLFSRNDAGNVAGLLVVEDDDGDAMLHTVMHRLRIHDLQILIQHIAKCDFRITDRVRIADRVF
jgi:hypothetical protein